MGIRRVVGVLAGVALLGAAAALALAARGSDSNRVDPATPAATDAPAIASPGPPARPSATGDDLGVQASEPPADDGPPPTDGGLPAGDARLGDATGDVADPEGNSPDPPVPAADLLGVALASDGRILDVAFELAAPPPEQVTSLLWSVELAAGGERAYTLTVQQVGARLFAGVYDWLAGEQHELADAPILDERLLRLRVPGRLLPRMSGPATWSALTQFDGAYEDYAPEPDAPDARFPG